MIIACGECGKGRRVVRDVVHVSRKGTMETNTRISGATRLIGVIGSTLEYSSSPEIHNASFEKLGCDFAYVPLDVDENDLEKAVRGLEALGFLGYNVAAPHKKRIAPYLDEVSQVADIMGAVNTVVIQDGRSLGDNADGAAFMRELVMNGINILGKKITVLGVGGAASAVIVRAALDGVAQNDVFNRDDSYVAGGKELIERLGEHSSCEVTLYDLADEEQLKASIRESVLLLNATYVGSPEVPGCLVDESMMTPDLIVADMVYAPRETEMLARAKANGNKTLDGVGVFLQQAAIGERLWVGREMPLEYIHDRFFA